MISMKLIEKIKVKIWYLKFKLINLKRDIRAKKDIERYIENDIKCTRAIYRGLCIGCRHYNFNKDTCSKFGKYLSNERVDDCSAYTRVV